ncbi:MAG: HEPN domain-containing protein [Pyrobaculum sp.]
MQAERDLQKAENGLVIKDWDGVAFWSQQVAEKALKALLLRWGQLARTHNLLELGALISKEVGIDVGEVLSDLRELTIHYTVSRYPNAANAVPYELYDEAKARELVERARRVLACVRRNLR